MNNKFTIAINAHSLQVYGGVERIACWLANRLSVHGHKVFLFVIDPPSSRPYFKLEPGVQLVHHRYNGDSLRLPAFQTLIQACAPDLCISLASSREHFIWLAALWDTGIPLIYSEHGDADNIENESWNRKERIAAMSGADAIHLLRESGSLPLPQSIANRVSYIPNPAPERTFPAARPEASHLLLSLGRLAEDKQNSLLIEAFSRIADNFPQWSLEIWGDGPCKENLQNLTNQLKLYQKISLPGTTNFPEDIYARAAVFCLPSRHEGMPNTILEALYAGLPIAAFASCHGAAWLVNNGKTGLLAPEMTVESYAHCLHLLMRDDSLRKQMGQAALEASTHFSPDSVYAQWERLIFNTVTSPNIRLRPEFVPESEESDHYTFLKQYITRQNIYFPDNERLRIFVHRHPRLHAIQHFVRHHIKRFI